MKIYYNLGKFRVMLIGPSDKKTWWGIYDYLNRYHKDLKEEGWRLPTPPELFYINDICNYYFSIINIMCYIKRAFYRR